MKSFTTSPVMRRAPLGARALALAAATLAAVGVLTPAVAVAQQPEARRPMVTGDLTGMHVAVLVGKGFHDGETLMPMAYLQNRGARITVIGESPDLVEAYNSDFTVRVERSVADVSVQQFDALIIPGGRSPANLRENERIVEFAREFFETGKPVAAICHGPQVLAKAGVLEGRQATCIEDISDEIKEAGAYYKDEPVVIDDNLITSRVPDDLPAFCDAIAQALLERSPIHRRRP